MKILQITPLYYPSLGGVQLHVQSISEALSKLGHQVVVTTVAHDRKLPRNEMLGGVEIRRFPALGPQTYHIPIGLFRYLKQKGSEFDVLHAHNIGGLPLLLTALACPERTVITPHYHGHGNSRLADQLHRIYDPLAANAFHHLGGIVCVSIGEARTFCLKFGVPFDSIKIIPNIISHINSLSVIEKRNVLDNQGNKCFLLVVGRLAGYKRIDRIIKSLPYLPNNYFLVIIGVGPEQSKLEELSRSFNIQDHVLFLGSVSNEDLFDWYSRAKVVISLSEGEAFGRIVIEALSSLCHVICSDIFAFRDFFEEFPETITLISSDSSSESIASAIQEVASRPIINSENLMNYSSQVVVSNLLNLYYDIDQRIRQSRIVA
jgi:glycosyltransferase involved in cell wall biosynthesis